MDKTHVAQTPSLKQDVTSKLPPELLSEVFSWCDKGFILLPPMNSSKLLDQMYVPEHVCSRWRAVALQTPHLWERVIVTVPPPDERKYTRLLALVHDVLARGTTSLRLTLEMQADNHGLLVMDDIIRPFSRQLKHLRVYSWCPGVLTTLLTSPPPFDILKSIHLTLTESLTPLLRPNIILDVDNLSSFPWAQLINLTLYNMSVTISTFHSILGHCHNLARCILDVKSDPLPLTADATIINNAVRMLRLSLFGNWSHQHYGFLFDPLTLPALESFNARSFNANWVHNATTLFSRSACPLASFTTSSPIPAPALENLLETVSSTLSVLEVPETTILDTTLRRVQARTLLPALRCIVYDLGQIPGPLCFRAFFDMLDARMDVRIAVGKYNHPRPKWLVDELRKYAAEGRNVRVR